MGRHYSQTSKTGTAFELAKFSFKTLNCVNYVSDPKAIDVLDPVALSSLGTNSLFRPKKNYPACSKVWTLELNLSE